MKGIFYLKIASILSEQTEVFRASMIPDTLELMAWMKVFSTFGHALI
jgi:hypothetical protein